MRRLLIVPLLCLVGCMADEAPLSQANTAPGTNFAADGATTKNGRGSPATLEQPEHQTDETVRLLVPKLIRNHETGEWEQADALEPSKVDMELIRAQIAELRALQARPDSSGCAPMPFGGSMFGPWDTGQPPEFRP
jgi:hypothetical protein